MHIIDRRLNPSGKSLSNRQRFVRRAKALLQRAVRDSTRDRSIEDLNRGGEVTIPVDGLDEPRLRRGDGGQSRQDHVLPGNKRFVAGDRVERPEGGGGKGGGSKGSPDGDGTDEFRFVLTREEFLELFLEDLELPDLAKRKLATAESRSLRRAGYTVAGTPSNLDVGRTMRNALARRIALNRPKLDDLERLEAEVDEAADPEAAETAREALDRARMRTRRVPYIDPLDLRSPRHEVQPRLVAQAVMFCLMDVSGSMTEHMKDLAKRFFMLLHLFLTRRYTHVDVVFIRHTHEAREVDEEAFFRSTETGGTVVSSALAAMKRIIEERYDPAVWNIYAAQASDGDNESSDGQRVGAFLREILPLCQYFAYLEVGQGDEDQAYFIERRTVLWRTYQMLQKDGVELAMRKVRHRREIYPVFRELFRRRDGAAVPDRAPA